MAKLIIKLIHQVAEVINRDLHIEGKLMIVFLPNHNVSLDCGYGCTSRVVLRRRQP